jgi:hypothetical protein
VPCSPGQFKGVSARRRVGVSVQKIHTKATKVRKGYEGFLGESRPPVTRRSVRTATAGHNLRKGAKSWCFRLLN